MRQLVLCGAVLAYSKELSAQDAEARLRSAAGETQSDQDAFNAGEEKSGPFKLTLFVDAYAAWQTSEPGTLATRSNHLAFAGLGSTGRAENGLSLAFLGVDAVYDAGSYGLVANFRFGQAATLFHGDDDALFGVDHITQAYALYRPVERVELDLGMFMSPFGYEALETWKNPNYTISALYTYGQPNWHTGFRGTWQVDDSLSVMGCVINGINNISETQQQSGLNQTPSVGGAITYQVSSTLTFTLSGLLALNQERNDDEGFDRFADFVAAWEIGPLLSALNADYIFTQEGAPDGPDRHFFGVSLTEGVRINDMFGVAARGEYLRDDASYDGRDVWHLLTGTITLDVKPIPNKAYLVVRWENRWERSNQRIYGKTSRGTEDPADDTYRHHWFESVLGVVVTTNL